MNYFVYYLLDPKTEEILYIGRSRHLRQRKGCFERDHGRPTIFGIPQRFSSFEAACEAEREAIAFHRPPFNTYVASAKGGFGSKRSEWNRWMVSLSRSGQKKSPEMRAKLSTFMKGNELAEGRPCSEETRRKISESMKARKAKS